MRLTRKFATRVAVGLVGMMLVTGCASGGRPIARAGQAQAAADESVIRALRADNNRAIAAHDLARFTAMFDDDAVFVWSGGGSAVGKAALARDFAEDFAEPGFITYIRSPQRLAVSANRLRAVEHGTWTALKRQTRYGGDYTAHWARTSGEWRVRGELYVKLYCNGPLCTP